SAAPAGLIDDSIRPKLQPAMSAHVGVVRDHEGFAAGLKTIAEMFEASTTDSRTENWEATNLLTVASAIAAAAQQRTETRGSHWRDDFPHSDPSWRGHLTSVLRHGGSLQTDFVPL